jgi:hypothetical protein
VPRVVRLLIGAGALVVAVLGAMQAWHGLRGVVGVGSTPTVVDNGRLAIKQAAGDFLALAKGSETSGQPPRQTDPKVKGLLDTVFDTTVLETEQPLPRADMNNTNEWMMQVLSVGVVYILAGTGYADFSKLDNLDQAAQQTLQQQVAKNTVAFAPEMGRYLDAQVAVFGALVWSVSADMAAVPDNFKSAQSQDGVSKMRSGLVNTLTGVLTTLPTDGLNEDWRQQRIPALAAVAPKAAAFLLPDQRKAVHDVALQVAGQMTDASVKNGLTAFAQAISG